MTMPELDDTTLVAYVDGELDAATAREVEHALETAPAARDTVAKLRASASLVSAAFADAVHEPPSPALVTLLRATQPRRRPRRYLLPIAASIALLVGLGAGALGTRQLDRASAPEPQAKRLVDEVAQYHRVYAREQRHLVEVAATETPHIEEGLGGGLRGRRQVP